MVGRRNGVNEERMKGRRKDGGYKEGKNGKEDGG